LIHRVQRHIRLQPLIPQLGQRVKVQVHQPHIRHLLSGIQVAQRHTRLQLLIPLLGRQAGVQADQRHIRLQLCIIQVRVHRGQPLLSGLQFGLLAIQHLYLLKDQQRLRGTLVELLIIPLQLRIQPLGRLRTQLPQPGLQPG
jgi:hypothetical protein